jgi:hypothetical protein
MIVHVEARTGNKPELILTLSTANGTVDRYSINCALDDPHDTRRLEAMRALLFEVVGVDSEDSARGKRVDVSFNGLKILGIANLSHSKRFDTFAYNMIDEEDQSEYELPEY